MGAYHPALAMNTTTCHGLSHAVDGITGTVHGEILAAMTPQTMHFSMVSNPEKFRKIGLLLRDQACETADDFTAEDAVQEVEILIWDIGLDVPLSKQGVKESDLEAIADSALEYMSGAFDLDLRKPNRDDLMGILRDSL